MRPLLTCYWLIILIGTELLAIWFLVSCSASLSLNLPIFFQPFIVGLPLIIKILIDLIGIWAIGVGISIIQRTNFVMHPLDGLTNLARFKFFHGSAPLGQISNFIVAVSISLVCWLISGKILGYGIGTLYCFFLQGNNIAWGDKHLFKHLLHIDPTKL